MPATRRRSSPSPRPAAHEARSPSARGRASAGDRMDGRPVPVAPDPTHIDGMLGGGGVEVGARRPALVGQAPRRVLVERRRADRHRHDPLALRRGRREAPHEALDLRDRAAARQRGIDALEALTVEVGVGVDEAGDDGGAAHVDDARAARPSASHLGPSADGHHAPAGHRQRLGDGSARVEREDAPALENPVGGYFIHPFSRYARSAPGCRGMPTFSGRHADFGSNSASPAWPRTSASLLSRTVLVIVYATGSGSSVFVITTVGNPTVVSGFAWPLNVSAGIVAGT